MPKPLSEAQEPEAQDFDPLQSSGDGTIACQDSGTLTQEIASGQLLYFVIGAAIIIVCVVGAGASISRSSTSLEPEIATISEDGPAKAKPDKTNRSEIPTPDTSVLGAAPQSSPMTVVNNFEQPRSRRQNLRHRPNKSKRR